MNSEKVLNDLEELRRIMTKSTATGAEITLNDSANAKIDEIKFLGKIEQDNYTGQQLFNCQDTNNVGNNTRILEDDWIQTSYDNSEGTSVIYENFFTNNLKVKENTTYAIILEVAEISGTGKLYLTSFYNQTGQFNSTVIDFSNLATGTYVYQATTLESLESITSGTRTYVQFSVGQSGSITYRVSVLADTTITTNTFKYEKYVRGSGKSESRLSPND